MHDVVTGPRPPPGWCLGSRGPSPGYTIKTKFEAFVVIYGLALGATERGSHYLSQYPGAGGWLLFAACPVAVFMAGGRILDSLDHEARERG